MDDTVKPNLITKPNTNKSNKRKKPIDEESEEEEGESINFMVKKKSENPSTTLLDLFQISTDEEDQSDE